MNLILAEALLGVTEASLEDAASQVAEARHQGHTAGRLLFGASMNPYSNGSPLYAVWDRARMQELGRSLTLAASFC